MEKVNVLGVSFPALSVDVADPRPMKANTAQVHGQPIRPLPEGYVLLEAVVLAKVIDASGRERWIEQWTPGLGSMERLGMLTSAARTCERMIEDGTGRLGS